MDDQARASEARFVEYIESLAPVLGHVDRTGPLKDYCTGLLMPGERKSVEPIASVIAPSHVSAEHQSLLHFVGQSAWSDEAMLAKVRDLVLPAMETQGRIEAWIVDDTGFVKKGVHSVGVARQYCGRLGKTDNCQVAVTLSIANHQASLVPGLDPGIAYRLYLPEEWANDAARRSKAHVPDDVKFRTKPEIALRQIRAALMAGVAPGAGFAPPALRAGGGRGARRRSDRRRLRVRWRIPRRRHRDGADLCGGRAVDDQRLAPRHGAFAAQALERTRAQALARTARGRSSAGLGQDAGDDAAERGLARGVMARGLQPTPDLALRRRADTARLARRQAHGPTTARMAADRVARRRARADQILALDPARRHSDRSSRRYRETALAHRTRL